MAQYLDKDGLDNLLSMINNNFVKFGDLSIPKPKMIACTQVEDWSYEDFETFASEFIGENPVVFYMSELATVSPLTLVVNEDGMCEFHSICKVNETSMVKVVISATADEEGNYTVTQNLVEIPLEGGSGEVPTKTSELTNDSGFITASDNVASATKLQTMRYINGSPFDGTANVVNYAVCTTGASTTAKTVSISRFSLVTGAKVRVEFDHPNTASAPTLNVGSTGAKRMSYKGSLITNTNFTFNPNKIYTFTYNGTYWVLEGDWDEAPKTFSDLSNNNFITCQFVGEVDDVIYSTDDQNSIAHIENWIDELGMGKVCVLDHDDDYYSSVIAFNFRTDANLGMGKCHFSYIFDGYLYDVEYESVSLPVTLTIVNKTKIGGEGGGSSEGGSSAYAEVDHGTSDTTFELTPNTFHVWDEVASLDLSLGTETSGVANEYLFQFTSGSTPTTLTLPDGIKWTNDTTPTISSNKIYQISILKGLGSVLEFANAPVRIDNLCIYDGSKTVTFQYPVDSDVTVSVAGKTVTILKGEQSGSISGMPEPMGQITNIIPYFDNTYNYIY